METVGQLLAAIVFVGVAGSLLAVVVTAVVVRRWRKRKFEEIRAEWGE
ncbi:hypothetical protein [Streptomyces sp. NK15101]|nr:hypothetical protein [Streptomyces sp. NK15101]